MLYNNMNFKEVRIIFVIPETCEDQTQTSAVMQDAYTMCKQNLMKTSWKDQTEGQIDMRKTDFLVFQDFSGPVYQQAINSKSVILGPWCLLTCLTKGTDIPNVTWPLLNMAMDACVVACSAVPKEQKQQIKTRVEMMGGFFTTSLVANNTHLITNSVRSEKYYIAAPKRLNIMLPSWVEDVWNVNKSKMAHADDEMFSKHQCQPLQWLSISVSGFQDTEKDELQALITNNGGTFTKELFLKSTDILICNGSSSNKYIAAKKNNIECVTAEWLYDSVKVGYAIPSDKKYLVKRVTSTPTKTNDQTGPNFSMVSVIAGPSLSGRSVLQETVNISQMGHLDTSVARATTTKRISPFKIDELIGAIDVKKAKKAGAFLEGCSIYLVGFNAEHHAQLFKFLNFSGATRYDVFSERVTHIVVGDPSCNEVNLIREKNNQCYMVSVEWLIDSSEKRHPVSEDIYLISAPTSTSPKNSSPLVKKVLQFLQSDVSTLENEEPHIGETKDNNANLDPQDNILMQYLKPGFEENGDTLAAMLTAYTLNSPLKPGLLQSNSTQRVSVTKTTANASADASSPSISITYDESVLVFLNSKFIISDRYETEQFENLQTVIEHLGGTVADESYRGTVDYAVVPVQKHELNRPVSEVVTDLWLTECVETKSVPDMKYYHRPYVVRDTDVLTGLVISFSGYVHFEKSYLRYMCESMGATVQDSLARVTAEAKNLYASTHLVSAEDSGKKYQAAVKWGLTVVSKDWIMECASRGKQVNMHDYLIGSCKEKYDGNKSTSSESMLVDRNTSTETPKKGGTLNTSRLDFSISRPTSSFSKPLGLSPTVAESPARTGAMCPADPSTPKNADVAVCSQITPVNQIMKEFRSNVDLNFPVTPKPWDYVKTPTSPIGHFICDNPPVELQKNLARWFDGFPSLLKSRERCLSTPLSELKRRMWNNVCPDFVPNVRKKNPVPAPNFDTEDDMEVEPLPCGTSPREKFEDTPVNPLADKKLQQFEEMLKNSGSKRRSIRKIDPIPMEEVPNKLSQPFSVGWDENMECRNVNEQLAISKVFMISAVECEERETLIENIEKLGATVSSLSNYDPASTHLICRNLQRSEKLLASIAAGKWVLHPSYIDESIKVGRMLKEDDYEFGNPRSEARFTVETECVERSKSVHYWRKEIARRGYGAFYDMRVIIVAVKREPLARVIEAGGGMVINASPPFSDTVFATHCLIEMKSFSNFKDYVVLAKKGVLCVNSVYVHDFLTLNAKDIKEYIVPCFANYY